MNPYEILGIPTDSPQSVIKKAYRTKAKQFHPDVCKEDNASEKFKEILKAYELLKQNNWFWNTSISENINMDAVYADFLRNNPIYAYYFEGEVLKSQARWDSLRKKPR